MGRVDLPLRPEVGPLRGGYEQERAGCSHRHREQCTDQSLTVADAHGRENPAVLCRMGQGPRLRGAEGLRPARSAVELAHVGPCVSDPWEVDDALELADARGRRGWG